MPSRLAMDDLSFPERVSALRRRFFVLVQASDPARPKLARIKVELRLHH
jgi:hypothetical protein